MTTSQPEELITLLELHKKALDQAVYIIQLLSDKTLKPVGLFNVSYLDEGLTAYEIKSPELNKYLTNEIY